MWYNKIYHFKPEGEASSNGDELQTEYFVALSDLPRVLESFNSQSFVLKNLL
jgi:hypothetical protein